MDNVLAQLDLIKEQIQQMQDFILSLQNTTTIPQEVDVAFKDRLQIEALILAYSSIQALLTTAGVLAGDGTGGFTGTVPLAGTKVYYVANSSGGAVTRKLTFTNGILVAEV